MQRHTPLIIPITRVIVDVVKATPKASQRGVCQLRANDEGLENVYRERFIQWYQRR